MSAVTWSSGGDYELVDRRELTRLRLSDLTYKDAIRQKALAEDECDEWKARAKQAEAKLERIEEAERAIAERDAAWEDDPDSLEQWDDAHSCDPDCPCEVETRAIDYDRLADAIVEGLRRDRMERARELVAFDAEAGY